MEINRGRRFPRFFYACSRLGSAQVERFFNATTLEALACVQNERVYDVTLSGLNAWFEARQVEPHVS